MGWCLSRKDMFFWSRWFFLSFYYGCGEKINCSIRPGNFVKLSPRFSFHQNRKLFANCKSIVFKISALMNEWSFLFYSLKTKYNLNTDDECSWGVWKHYQKTRFMYFCCKLRGTLPQCYDTIVQINFRCLKNKALSYIYSLLGFQLAISATQIYYEENMTN